MEKATILIVEDEAIVAAYLTQVVRRMGYEVVGTAATGEEAIDLANQFCPRLVIMDIMLKGKPGGIKAALAIQELCEKPAVIFIPGSDHTDAIKAAKIPGPHCVLFKPFGMKDLHFQIERMLKLDSKMASLVQPI